MRQRNVPLGIVFGVGMAMIYSVVAVVMYFLGGGASGASYTIFGMVGAYWVGGIVGGALLGFLFPLTNSRLGSTVVGVLVAIPAVVGVASAGYGWPGQWDENIRFSVVVTSFMLGAICGYLSWSPPTASQDERR